MTKSLGFIARLSIRITDLPSFQFNGRTVYAEISLIETRRTMVRSRGTGRPWIDGSLPAATVRAALLEGCKCTGTTHDVECLPLDATDPDLWLAQERVTTLRAQALGTQEWIIDVINAEERVRRLAARHKV